MTSANDGPKLWTRYKSWNAEDLVRATTLESQEYTPEAISLMLRELPRRDLTLQAQESVESRVVEKDHSEQRSFMGVRGWLLVLAVIFAFNFGSLLFTALFALDKSLPAFLNCVIILEALVGVYGIGSFGLLISRHPKGPDHAKLALVTLCFLAIGSWLALYWRGFAPGLFSIGAVIITCVWWSYLSYSRRVRFTYAPRAEVSAEPGSTR